MVSSFGICWPCSQSEKPGCSGRSDLLKMYRLSIPSIRRRMASSSASGFWPMSSTINRRSALLMASRARLTPMRSTVSSLSLMPAVSFKCMRMPSSWMLPSTVSRVVPGMSVTMARSSINRALSREDLPALGLPQMTTRRPSSSTAAPRSSQDASSLFASLIKSGAMAPTASSSSISSG